MPTPPFTRQTSFGPSLGQLFISPVSAEIPFRAGPKNCGQSAAGEVETTKARRREAKVDFMGKVLGSELIPFGVMAKKHRPRTEYPSLALHADVPNGD